MSEFKAKRFWTKARHVPCDVGFTVHLDDRPVRTPAKAPLVVPSEALAVEVVAEWDAQVDEIDPLSMPMTRSVNAAIDKVAVQFAEVAELIAAYGDSDLVCYRAESPDALIQRQALAWDPLIGWVSKQFDVTLATTSGVMPVAQPRETSTRFRAEVARLSPFELTAFHDLVSLSGSLVIGLATIHRYSDAPSLWNLSRIDEFWQQEQWGEDDEALALAERKRAAFLQAHKFFEICA